MSNQLNDPGLVCHSLRCSEVYFTTIIFYYIEQTPPDVQWRNREKRNYQEHEKASFFNLAEIQNAFFFTFFRKRLIHFLRGLLLLCYLFLQENVQIAVQRCSTKQMLLKILQYTQENLCWSFFLINLIEKRLQHRCFSVNISKCLGTAFYVCYDRIIWTSFGAN